MNYCWKVAIVLAVHACSFLTAASLFSDECLRHGLDSAYDPTTDSCWIAEMTPNLLPDMAQIRCNHMPGYEGHLGFPMTTAEISILYTKLGSNAYYGWIGLRHNGLVTSNQSEWFWTYPNGTMVNSSGSALPWYPGHPTTNPTYKCTYPYGLYIATTTCTNAGFNGFFCQYERKTAHHETMLEHKCKATSKWFWWEESKSCLVFDPLWRNIPYAELICTHIPGYRGHLAHILTNDKLMSTISVLIKVQGGASSGVGFGRDPNITTSTLDGLFWRRPDGYKLAFDLRKYPAHTHFDEIAAIYGGIWSNYYLDDYQAIYAYQPICEYQEDLRYAPTPLDIKCSQLALPHLYYKGSCYVYTAASVAYKVAKQSCNHIDGFGGHLAALPNTELLNIIYYSLIQPNGGNGYYWVGLERLNTTLTDPLAGYYWNADNGQYFPLTDYSAFSSGYPNGFACGNAYINTLRTGDASTCTGGQLYSFICEYVEPQKGNHFRVQANFANMKVIPQAILKLYDDLYMPEQCGYQCTKELSCRSIVFNVGTGICLLQSYDSSVAKTNIVSAYGYQWFDRY